MRTISISPCLACAILLSLAAFGCNKDDSGSFELPTEKPVELDPFAEKPPASVEITETDDAPPEGRLGTIEDSTSAATANGLAGDSGKPPNDQQANKSGPRTSTLTLEIKLLPLPVVERQFQALKEGDLSKGAKDNWIPDEDELRKTLVSRLKAMSAAASADELAIEGIEQYISGTWAVVPIKIDATKDGKKLQGISDQYLIKTDKGWKVAPVYLHEDPKLKVLVDIHFQAVSDWYRKNEPRLKRDWLE